MSFILHGKLRSQKSSHQFLLLKKKKISQIGQKQSTHLWAKHEQKQTLSQQSIQARQNHGGGFSAGDEPDGSGKFIANVIREKRIADAITSHLEKKNLVLGICNGFQALIKTGLVPYGRITEPSAETPTLTFNDIHRHISRVVWTRMVSAASGKPTMKRFETVVS